MSLFDLAVQCLQEGEDVSNIESYESDLYGNIVLFNCYLSLVTPKIVSEYDQEIPQSQTADNLVAPCWDI